MLRVGVNPLRPSLVGRRICLGVVLPTGATMASAGPGAGESKSSGARLFLLPEGNRLGEAGFVLEIEDACSTGRHVSIREAGRGRSGVL